MQTALSSFYYASVQCTKTTVRDMSVVVTGHVPTAHGVLHLYQVGLLVVPVVGTKHKYHFKYIPIHQVRYMCTVKTSTPVDTRGLAFL